VRSLHPSLHLRANSDDVPLCHHQPPTGSRASIAKDVNRDARRRLSPAEKAFFDADIDQAANAAQVIAAYLKYSGIRLKKTTFPL
jgi:hypothetical protein